MHKPSFIYFWIFSCNTDGAVVGGTSSRSFLGMLGLSKHNSTASAMNTSHSHHSNKSLLLKNDDNFLEHRKLLVQRWKQNIYNKYPKQQFSPSPSPSSKHGSSFMYPDSTIQEDEEVSVMCSLFILFYLLMKIRFFWL